MIDRKSRNSAAELYARPEGVIYTEALLGQRGIQTLKPYADSLDYYKYSTALETEQRDNQHPISERIITRTRSEQPP
jgi:hypothetical protein